MARKPWHHQVESSNSRGYGAQWRRLREIAFARDGHLCQPCVKAGRLTAATDCDHIVPKAKGGTDDLENLQAICNDCHVAKTADETVERQRVRPRSQYDATGRVIW